MAPSINIIGKKWYNKPKAFGKMKKVNAKSIALTKKEADQNHKKSILKKQNNKIPFKLKQL